jgi:hypothetical protein
MLLLVLAHEAPGCRPLQDGAGLLFFQSRRTA